MMQRSNFRISLFLILILFCDAVVGSSSAGAQAYVPISPNSDLNCVYAPAGKTQIATQDGDTYKIVSFSNVTKGAVKRKKSYVQKAGQLKALIKKLGNKRKKGIFELDINSKEYKQVSKFIFDGQIGTAPPVSVAENIQILAGLESTYNSDAKYEQELIKLIENCKKRKIPPQGTLYTKFVNIIEYRPTSSSFGSGYVAVMAIVPYNLTFGNPNLCFYNGVSSIRYEEASKDPCFTAGLSNKDPDTCENLITFSNGYPDYFLAVLDAKPFSYGDKAGQISFSDAAKAAEATLRTSSAYLWGDSVSYAIGSVDNCNHARFQ